MSTSTKVSNEFLAMAAELLQARQSMIELAGIVRDWLPEQAIERAMAGEDSPGIVRAARRMLDDLSGLRVRSAQFERDWLQAMCRVDRSHELLNRASVPQHATLTRENGEQTTSHLQLEARIQLLCERDKAGAASFQDAQRQVADLTEKLRWVDTFVDSILRALDEVGAPQADEPVDRIRQFAIDDLDGESPDDSGRRVVGRLLRAEDRSDQMFEERNTARAERDTARKELEAELASRVQLRKRYGAKDTESFSEFVDRLARSDEELRRLRSMLTSEELKEISIRAEARAGLGVTTVAIGADASARPSTFIPLDQF